MLIRCNLCHREFEGPKLACVQCGLDPAKKPRDREHLVELAMIHYDEPTKIPGRGVGHAACDPAKRVGTGGMFSGEKTAVTCPKCKVAPSFTGEVVHPPMPDETLRFGSLEKARAEAGVA